MKPNIHPKVSIIKVHCGCGNEFETLATVSEMRLELCGACHPTYTGKKRNISAAGRVQRFEEKYKATGNAPVVAAKKPAAKAKKK